MLFSCRRAFEKAKYPTLARYIGRKNMEGNANTRRLEIWRRMTPEQRDYDRYQGVIPIGASWTCETKEGQENLDQRREEKGLSFYETGCTCHINPPCSFCVRGIEDEE